MSAMRRLATASRARAAVVDRFRLMGGASLRRWTSAVRPRSDSLRPPENCCALVVNVGLPGLGCASRRVQASHRAASLCFECPELQIRYLAIRKCSNPALGSTNKCFLISRMDSIGRSHQRSFRSSSMISSSNRRLMPTAGLPPTI